MMKNLIDDSADIELIEFIQEALEGVELPPDGLLIEIAYGPDGTFPSFTVTPLESE